MALARKDELHRVYVNEIAKRLDATTAPAFSRFTHYQTFAVEVSNRTSECARLPPWLFVLCALPVAAHGDCLLRGGCKCAIKPHNRRPTDASYRPPNACSSPQPLHNIAVQPRIAADPTQWRLCLPEATVLLTGAVPSIWIPRGDHTHHIQEVIVGEIRALGELCRGHVQCARQRRNRTDREGTGWRGRRVRTQANELPWALSPVQR